MPTWRVDAPGPFPRVARAQYTAPVAFWRYGSRFQRVARAHYTIPAPFGPLAYSGRLVRCLGCPLNKTHLSTATLPANDTDSKLPGVLCCCFLFSHVHVLSMKVTAFAKNDDPDNICLSTTISASRAFRLSWRVGPTRFPSAWTETDGYVVPRLLIIF